MLVNNRIILSKSGTLTDVSIDANDYINGLTPLALATTDALYIGSDMPFNHRYFSVKTANIAASKIVVQYWTGATWFNPADLFDLSATSGKTLAKSGIVAWVPDHRQTPWGRSDTLSIPDLNTYRIYNHWWNKITFTGPLDAGTVIGYIGHKFSEDYDLYSQYPELNSSAFFAVFDNEAGKTTWDRQAFLAAEYIIADLREKGVIFSSSQILDWRTFKNASVHKIAEIVYRAMGDDYKAKMDAAMKAYAETINMRAFNVDQNENAILETREETRMSESLTR